MRDPLSPGLRGEATLTVGEEDTAIAQRSGDVAVLATPRIVALVEEAAVAALAGLLPAEQTSVGTRIQLSHGRPSPIGTTVSATAELVAVQGRRLEFTVRAGQEDGQVATGLHSRVLVDRSSFPG